MTQSGTTFAVASPNDADAEEVFGIYGLRLVCEHLRRCGHRIVAWPTDEPATILTSVNCAEQLYNLAGLRDAAPGRTIVAGGTYAWCNPALTLCFADRVFVGDGEGWDGSLNAPHMLAAKPAEPVEPREEPVVPLCFEVGHRSRFTANIELSRGCPRRCYFCQYSWLRQWRIADETDALAAVQLLTARQVVPRTADRGRIPWYGRWHAALGERRVLGGETSILRILEDPSHLGELHQIRVGIDGLSARLRKMVGKPITTEQILEACRLAKAAGLRRFMFYMIWGLPSETDADVAEFEDLLQQLAAGPLRNGSCAVGWNGFQPEAMTPMQWCPSATDRDTAAHRAVINNRRFGLSIMHRPKPPSRGHLTRRLVAMRASPASANIVRAYARRPSVARHPDIIRREFERVEGVDPCGAWPADKPLPWDGWIAHDRGRLESIAKRRGWLGGTAPNAPQA